VSNISNCSRVVFSARGSSTCYDLERQDDIADLAALAVPDQFHLTLVLEQQKAKLVRQGLAGLQEFCDVTYFVIGELHYFPLGLVMFLDRSLKQADCDGYTPQTQSDFALASYLSD